MIRALCRRRGLSFSAAADQPWHPLSPPSADAPLPSLSPPAPPLEPDDLRALVAHVGAAERLLVVTGAGISTTSGIPDYRSPQGSYSRGHKPIQHHEFVTSAAARERYWTRSFVGWRYFSHARPNAAHRALAELEARGHVHALVTQNVDGLHSAAGHVDVLDLHGRIDAVECLSCGTSSHRAAWQRRLSEHNAEWARAVEAEQLLPGEMRADGDSEVAGPRGGFAVPSCDVCGGVIKPSVVFFGGSVPSTSVQAAADAVAAADALLVVGSSLQVFSAFRIARAAAQRNLPIAILNNGPTRADQGRDMLPGVRKIVGDATEALPAVAEELW